MSDPPAPTDDADLAPGTSHERLEGWVPPLADDAELCAALEKAFDYRGDVTVTLKDGRVVDGYVFDRHAAASGADGSYVRLLPKGEPGKRTIHYRDIARLAFTGRDTAAGKSFETWVRKYNEKKAAGEKGIGIDPDTRD